MASVNIAPVEFGVATLALPGQSESGDLHVVQPVAGGLLVAAVDGVGHGEEAAIAARTATATLAEHAPEPLISIVRACHQALHMSRGAVMSLASFDIRKGLMSWLGVGNILGLLAHSTVAGADPAEERLLLRPGVVGYELPPLQAAVLPVSPGDTLVFATDGIRPDFPSYAILEASPQAAADQILAEYSKRTDDALVLVARYLGNPT